MEAVFAIFALLIIFTIGIQIVNERYHEKGTVTDERTIKELGKPVKSLYTSTEVLTLHHEIDVTDESDKVAYHSYSKFLTLVDETDITRADGSPVAHVERKMFTIHEIHYVMMHDGTNFTLSNELFHLIKDVTRIDELGWTLQGNLLALNFVLSDKEGKPVAAISQKMMSIHDKYSIDIYQPEYEELVVTIVITLQHMIRDRENNSAAASGSAN